MTKEDGKENTTYYPTSKMKRQDFPGGLVVKNPPASAGDTGLIPGLGRFHRQLSPFAEPLKPTHPRACAPQQEKLLQ